MTIKDGFKLGVGIALAFVVVGAVLGGITGAFAGLSSSSSGEVYVPRPPTYVEPKGGPETWGCGRQCRIIDRAEVCVDNPPCR
jgi:hypothetical protein